ncbi:penicillin-binding protein 2, partial [Candidatus Poribacteria bacterium]|nr:penicillin-binding protein 2 [Candidatus Poribacteria bacterium]
NITNQHRGLKIEIEPERVYPKKKLASQVIGYLNDLNHGEGIEYQYNTFLQRVHSPQPQGNTGLQSVSLQNTSSTALLGNSGCNVVLTIDEIIQDIAEKELEQACKDWNAPKGTAIVLAVETSEILAMASCPSYDINDQTRANEEAKRNLGIWYLFEPGSIFKVVASSAVLNEGIMSPVSTVFCEYGRYRLSNRRVIKDVSAKGDLSLTEVIQKSSNIGMIKIVERLGPNLFQKYVDRFGFGEKTGIDLPYEQIGSLYALRKWDTNSLGSVPFGQGISVTPLQMVNALAAIANGGTLHRPYITKEIRDDRGNLVKKNRPEQIRQVIHPATARKMTDILVGVVEKGSGMRARIDGVSIAGKTGTAQKAEKGKGYAAGKEVMSFMGFLPADNPKIAIIVTIDEPKGARFSGLVAAPVFKRIAQQTLEYSDRIGLFDSIPRRRNNNNRQYVEGNRSDTTSGSYTSKPKRSTSSGNTQNPSIPENTLVKNGVGL